MFKMNEEIYAKFSKHQIAIQRKNLVHICRLTVKTLVDRASITDINDDSAELINFCAAIEQILTYRQKLQRTWYGLEEVRPFWDFIQTACRDLPNNCINSIATLENVKSTIGKGRAWIRCVLMEKRLSEYLTHALQQTKLVRRFYQDGSVILSDDMNVLCGVLLGLNSIDFSFCLKGKNHELKSPLYIDYTPYLIFQQSEESTSMDVVELAELSKDPRRPPSVSESDGDIWMARFKELEKTHKNIKEQKGYLEELVRMREHQLHELQRKHQTLMNVFKKFDEESKMDRRQMENVVIELQQQLSSVTGRFETINSKYEGLVGKLNSGYIDLDEVTPDHSLSRGTIHNFEEQTLHVTTESSNIPESVKLFVPPSKRIQQDMKPESASMLAMAGSFTSQKSSDDADDSCCSNLPKSVTDSAAEEVIVVNFPGNNNQSNSSDGVVFTDDSSDPKDIPSSSAEMYSSKFHVSKPETIDGMESREAEKEEPVQPEIPSESGNDASQLSGEDNSSSLEIVQHPGPDNSSESERGGDDSVSSPEILHASDNEASNGSGSSVNEEQYDLVTDDVSKFDEENTEKSEENGNATG